MKGKDILEKDQLVFLQRKRKMSSNEFHIVQQGETLYDIAQEEGIRLESLAEYNRLKPHMIPAAGQKLNLQYKSSARPVLAEEIVAVHAVEDPVMRKTSAEDQSLQNILFKQKKPYTVSVKNME